jgi:hypothetical protein
MHHSGTSLTTGILTKLGYSVGKGQSTVTHFHNQKGYFENDTLRKIADKILSEHKCSWRTPPNPNNLNYQQLINKWSKILQNTLKSEFGDATRIVIKDPRWASFLPVISHALMAHGYKIYILETSRHEFDSIQSLSKTNPTPNDQISNICHMIQLGVSHFIQTNTNNVQHLQHLSTIQYRALLENPIKIITNLAKELNINVPSNLHEFVETKLCHYKTGICVYDEHFDYIHIVSYYQGTNNIQGILDHIHSIQLKNDPTKKTLIIIAIARNCGGNESKQFYDWEDKYSVNGIQLKTLFYPNGVQNLQNVYKYFLTSQKITYNTVIDLC